MDFLDLNKVTCRICITGDESIDGLSNLFTKTINETVAGATQLIKDESVLKMPLSDALVSFTCVELQQDYGLPETICRKCETQLIESLTFIHRTIDTQQILNSARSNHKTKVKTEDIDMDEEASYVIEALNDEGEVIQNEYEHKLSISAVQPNNSNEENNDCDAEDAVSFLKNIKREDTVCNTTESFRPKPARKRFSCNARSFECTYCKKSFFQSENLKSHLRTHMQKKDDSVGNETIDSYNSSTTSDSPQPKRRRKVNKKWDKVKEFLSFADAVQEIKEENIWSKCNTNTNAIETSVMYRCNRVKSRGEQCKAGLRLVISKSTEATILFKAQNEHTCDQINGIHLSIKAPIPEEVKKLIEELFEKGMKHKQIRLELIRLNMPLPTETKLNNYLKELRQKKFGLVTLSFGELNKLLTTFKTTPDNTDKAYVVDFNINEQDDGHFRFFLTSRTLLCNALHTKLVCTDTTHKLIWLGFPVHVVGTVDMNKKFHPFGIGVADKEEAEDFTFMYQCLRKATAQHFNFEFNPEILMSDGAKATSIGFEAAFGNNKRILMCWANMKKRVRQKVIELIPKSNQAEILDDIEKLQLSQRTDIFEKASMLFLKKYEQYDEFVKYFLEKWIGLNPNWYEGAAPFKTPSTDNALESFIRALKDEKSLRERLPLELFIKLLISWIESWGSKYSSGEHIIATTAAVDLAMLRKGYAWLLTNKELRTSVDGSMMVPAADQADLSKWNEIHQWDTFNEYKEKAFLGYTTNVPDGQNWINGTCTCPAFYKDYLCEHVVGIAMQLKYLQIPIEAKLELSENKKKRGRPANVKRALIRQ